MLLVEIRTTAITGPKGDVVVGLDAQMTWYRHVNDRLRLCWCDVTWRWPQ